MDSKVDSKVDADLETAHGYQALIWSKNTLFMRATPFPKSIRLYASWPWASLNR